MLGNSNFGLRKCQNRRASIVNLAWQLACFHPTKKNYIAANPEMFVHVPILQ